ITCITKMVDKIETQDQIIGELEQYQDGDGSFGKEIARRQLKNKNFDPAKWWLNHGTSSPNLRKLAARILGFTCSSSACERNWSSYEQVHTKRRNKLGHDRMKDLVFVKFNSKLKQKREDKNRDPIVVDFEEDEDNEWITDIPEQEQEEQQEQESNNVDEAELGSSQQQKKRKGSNQDQRKKKRKFIPVLNDGEASSSEDEDEAEPMQSPSASSSSTGEEQEESDS
ncbi:unnamed protein product, partial [Urochloa humidicola]